MWLISSLSLSDQLYAEMQPLARAGFDGVKIFREDMLGFTGTPADVAGLARGEDIAIATMQSLCNVEGLTCEAHVRAFRHAGRFTDFATELGAPILIANANCMAVTEPDPARPAGDLRRACGHVRKPQPAGAGGLPRIGFMRDLRAAAYIGPFSIEVLQVSGLGLISADPEGLRRAADPQGRDSQPTEPASRDDPFGMSRLDGPLIHVYLAQAAQPEDYEIRGAHPDHS